MKKQGMFKSVLCIALALCSGAVFAASKYSVVSVTVDGPGTVTGAKKYVAGKTATLKATADAGAVFNGWYLDDELVSRETTFKYVTPKPAANVQFVAEFVAAAEDNLEMDVEFMDYVDVGEEVEFALYADSITPVTFTVKGLPDGLKYDAADQMVKGAPTKKAKGIHYVTVTAKNANGHKDVRIARINVGGVDDEEPNKACVATVYGTYDENDKPATVYEDGFQIDNLGAGEPFEQDYRVGNGKWTPDKVAVSGLPTGLKAKCSVADGYGWFTVSGVPSKTGVFTAMVTATVGKSKTYVTSKTIMVQGTGSQYLRPVALASGSKDKGTVSGGGSATMFGNTVTFKAKPASGDYVFAGWYQDSSSTTPLEAEVFGDYRAPKLSFVLTEEVLNSLPDEGVFARFVHRRDDTLVIGEMGFAVEVGEKMSDTLEVESVSMPFVTTVKGLPPGVSFNKEQWKFKGAPTADGWYFATIAATNAGGYSFTQLFPICVGGAELPDKDEISDAYFPVWCARKGAGYEPDPSSGEYPEGVRAEYDTHTGFRELDDLVVGEYANVEFLEDLIDLNVEGLPAGLKFIPKEYGPGFASVKGFPTKAGRCKVTITAADPKNNASKLTMIRTIIVRDAPSRYITVKTEKSKKGTATGTGVYHPGKLFKASATPKDGYVFAGWSSGKDYLSDNAEGDYREPTAKLMVDGDLPDKVVATFATPAEDKKHGVAFGETDGDVWYVESAESSGTTVYSTYDIYSVDSLSKPTITAKGLPGGISLVSEGGAWSLKVAKAKNLKPGIYTVKFTAANLSGAKATKSIRVITPNDTTAVDKKAIAGLKTDTRTGYGVDAYGVMRAGVSQSFTLSSLGISAKSGWTIDVSGLPKGWKFKNGKITGVATQTGPVVVTFTATKGKKSYTATALFDIASVPEWIEGSFTGVLAQYKKGNEGSSEFGTVQFSVTSVGKISGKYVVSGTATSFTGSGVKYDSGKGEYTATVSDSDSGKSTIVFGSEAYGDYLRGRAVFSGTFKKNSKTYVNASVCLDQNLWKHVMKKKLPLPSVKKNTEVALGAYDGVKLSLKFGSSGAATATYGKYTCSTSMSRLAYDESAKSWTAQLNLVFEKDKKKKFGGLALVAVLQIDKSGNVAYEDLMDLRDYSVSGSQD